MKKCSTSFYHREWNVMLWMDTPAIPDCLSTHAALVAMKLVKMLQSSFVCDPNAPDIWLTLDGHSQSIFKAPGWKIGTKQ